MAGGNWGRNRPTRNRETRKPKRILKPTVMRREVTDLINEIQEHANLIPSWEDARELLEAIDMVITAEQRQKVFASLAGTEGYDGLRPIQPTLEKLAAKFGYTLQKRRNS